MKPYASNQFPVPKPSPSVKKYALYEGTTMVMIAETPEQYALLVWKKKQLSSQGHRFLKIKPKTV